MCTAALWTEEVGKRHLGCEWKGGCVVVRVKVWRIVGLGVGLDIDFRVRVRVRAMGTEGTRGREPASCTRHNMRISTLGCTLQL